MLLSRNEIKSYNDRKTERVAVPEWGQGAEVLVRMMSARQREIYESWALLYSEQRTAGVVGSQQLYARMAILSCVDEQGDQLFTDEDLQWLSEKSFAALRRIFDVAWRLNLFAGEEVEKATDFFDSTPPDDSGSGLPSPLVAAPSLNSSTA